VSLKKDNIKLFLEIVLYNYLRAFHQPPKFENRLVQAHTKEIFYLKNVVEESSLIPLMLRQFVNKLFSHKKILKTVGYELMRYNQWKMYYEELFEIEQYGYLGA